MLTRSQPLIEKIYKKLGLDGQKADSLQEQDIKAQRIGNMFDFADARDKKIDLKTRLNWKRCSIQNNFYDFKYMIRNHIKWHKTLCSLRPWEGFDGLLRVMQTHLRDYVSCEERYGTTEESFKKQKISSIKAILEVLDRMNRPEEYSRRLRKNVEAKYPKYKTLITEYTNGGSGSCCSGYFVAQGNGWAGCESGKNPREGYFEFINGIFELTTSPDQAETDRLLEELREYHREIDTAYKQAETDSDSDFEKLGRLLKENMYSWWD